MNAQIQAMITEYADYAPPFTVSDFFYCDRCRCIMLRERCEARLKRATSRKLPVFTIESMDVNCLQCEQGREMSGLWLDMPYKVCLVLTCRNMASANGLCDKHYKRVKEGTLTKVCITCGEDVALTNYHKKVDSSDGRQSSCKECMNKLSSEKWMEGGSR